jgi:hypothetical protein
MIKAKNSQVDVAIRHVVKLSIYNLALQAVKYNHGTTSGTTIDTTID